MLIAAPEEANHDPALLPQAAAIKGRRILITGGGGSIGRAMAERVAALGPSAVILLDHHDHSLINAMRVLEQAVSRLPIERRPALGECLCDVTEPAMVRAAFALHRPDVVIHAAALKHVHLGDRHPAACVLTNLFGVHTTLEAARAAGAERFLLISTDKAAAPVSVMGASKRLAEMYVRGAAGGAMTASAVRFGNVLGTQGSVTEVFARQIAEGGPITITHPEMRRYFMRLDEAVDLVLKTLSLDHDCDASPAYLLDMGHPRLVMDFARDMVREAGLRPDIDIGFKIIGLREGEKLNEELIDEHEIVVGTRLSGIMRITPLAGAAVIDAAGVEALAALARLGDSAAVKAAVFTALSDSLKDAMRPAVVA